MATNSSIEWTEATWNPVTGCTRVSPGCDNCYAKDMTYRMERMGQTAKYGGLTVLNGRGERHFNGVVRTHEDALLIPLKRRKPTTYFVNSMSDLFHRDVPFDFIDRVFAVMALCPQHTFQILTKRPERMAEYMNCREQSPGWSPTRKSGDEAFHWKTPCDKVYTIARETNRDNQRLMGDRIPLIWPLPNVWLGTSCENQATADERIPHLLRVPAAIRFLSLEPLLGPIDLRTHIDCKCGWTKCAVTGESCGIGWVIVGGESGPSARPCNVAWTRSIRDQCQAAGVPFFNKQLGSKPFEEMDCGAIGVNDAPLRLRDPKGGDMSEWCEDLRVREFPCVRVKGGVECD